MKDSLSISSYPPLAETLNMFFPASTWITTLRKWTDCHQITMD